MATHESEPSHVPQDYHRKPWKYAGYRDFASFVASDDSFFVLRRFSTLSARVLLALQDELVELEDQLNTIVRHNSNVPQLQGNICLIRNRMPS
jgi:hypothetical protein